MIIQRLLPPLRKMLLYILGLVAAWFIYRWYKESKRVPNEGDKYVFITGCDSGFGNNLAKHLDKLGFRVIAGCYTEKGEIELKKVSSERLTTIPLDVTKSESIKKRRVRFSWKVRLWAVVNNAGVGTPSGPCDWLNVEDYKSMLAVNLNGVIDVTLSVLQLIKKAKGRVVNVASVFGRISPFGGPYCVSKYGVEAFNDSLRLNVAPFGVKVLCIEPGFFKTSMSDTAVLKSNMKKLWDRLPQETKDDYGPAFLDIMLEQMDERSRQFTDGDLMKVVSCMEHAISALHPRYRYSPGWDAKFFWLPLSYMPSCLVDRFFLRYTPHPKVSVL
uniref:Dehydrogenase/reductase (SDR family) member 9 n=1 Tax=Nothobranchius furzeri TaxID=105023 RepID=A0A8C6Q6R0_NOTFU